MTLNSYQEGGQNLYENRFFLSVPGTPVSCSCLIRPIRPIGLIGHDYEAGIPPAHSELLQSET